MRNIIKIKPSSSPWTGWMVVVVPSELCECCVLVVEQGIIVCVPCLELDRPVKPNVLRYTWRDAEAAREVPPGYLRSICVVQVRETDRGKLAQIMQWIVMGYPRPHPSCAAMPGLALSRSWNKKEKVAGEAELKFPGNSFCLMSFGCWSQPSSATRPGHDDGWWIGEYS